MPVDNCIKCGMPVGDQPSYIIPWKKIHTVCQSIDGRHPDEIADADYCCPAREVLMQLLPGTVLQKDSRVMGNQFYVYDKDLKSVSRLRVLSKGPILFERIPEAHEPK